MSRKALNNPTSGNGRIIGIRHRVKATKEGEAKPTQVVIFQNGKRTASYDLASEQAELDFVHGIFPVEYRKVTEDEDISMYRPHQLRLRAVKKDEDQAALPQSLVFRQGRASF